MLDWIERHATTWLVIALSESPWPREAALAHGLHAVVTRGA
ncbi:hypothetical protein [Roseateles aquatilis]|nr:hypothetical protein [Roseateles aquatilis]